MTTRRDFLRVGFAGLAATALPFSFSCSGLRVGAGTPRRDYTIEAIDRVTVRLPYRDAPRRAMDRELPHWRYTEIFEVRLLSGAVGLGETLLYYTWGATGDDDVQRALGKNAVDLMWDDSLGAGLQIALFDAVARTADVPVHRLLGRQVHESTPLSWWNIDTSVEDMASECLEAYKSGYMSYKTKGRPWFDVWKQVDAAAKVVPEAFKIDMDFNDTLLDAERGIPILKDLEKYPQIDIYETPIPQSDVEGNRRIREATRVKIGLHYGTPSPRVVVEKGVCDGFVIGGGASRVMTQGSFSAQVGMPFWLQLVGTGITAAWSLHFGAVLSHATWPAVNCHQLYTHQLLKAPLVVEKGFAKVPTGPGLGYELDRDAVARFRVDKPASRPEPRRLIRTTWPDGRRMYIANDGTVNFMLRRGIEGKIPYYRRGADTTRVPDDGTPKWRELWEKAQKDPYFEEG
jgi:galactonate dehydratase